MTPLPTTRRAAWLVANLGDVLVLAWLFVYVLVMVEPRLVHQAQQPPFSANRAFFLTHVAESGGLARYVGLFMAQLDVINVVGALSRVLQALLLGLLSASLLGRLAGPRAVSLRYVPMVLFALLCGRYDQPLLLGPMLIATLAAARLFARGPSRFDLFLVLTLGHAYLVAGAGGPATLIWVPFAFGSLCGAVAAAVGEMRWWRRLLVCVGYALVAPLVAVLATRLGLEAFPAKWVFGVDRSALTEGLHLALLGFYPVAALVACLLPRRLPAATDTVEAEPRPAALRPRLLAAAALVAMLSLLTSRVTVDTAGHEHAYMDDCALRGEWGKLLIAAYKSTSPRDLGQYDVNRSLYGQGLMGEAMFQVPQRPDGLMLSVDARYEVGTRIRLADQLLDLGRLNLAEYALHNTYTMGGDNPYVLNRLALLYMAKGNLPAARIYLNRLRDNLVWRGWATRQLRQMASDPQLAGNEQVRRLREVALREDDLLFINNYSDKPEERAWYLEPEILSGLLRSNPRNRMAFEYLVSFFLLSGHPEYAAAELHRLRDFGQTDIPLAWSEAALLAMDLPGPKPDLRGLTLDDAAKRSYERFRAVVKQHRGNMRAAYPQLQTECAGSYFVFLVRTGLGL